jgi:hypothetical protein
MSATDRTVANHLHDHLADPREPALPAETLSGIRRKLFDRQKLEGLAAMRPA